MRTVLTLVQEPWIKQSDKLLEHWRTDSMQGRF
jgi:hypothetical protein